MNICKSILDAGVLEIRDLDAGQEPFLYSSGNWGPGYVMIKGLVSKRSLLVSLCKELSNKIMKLTSPDLVAGNVTGGMIPGWLISTYLFIPFVYVRDTRKKGGHREQVTGLSKELTGSCLIVEELVNFAQTTINSAEVLRNLGFEVPYAATILSYENPRAIKSLEIFNLNLISLITLPELLNEAEISGKFSKKAIRDYRMFLLNPIDWQRDKGLEPVPNGGTK